MGGDLNEILYHFEKKGIPMKQQSVLEEFRTTLADCDLHALGYWGHKYTWWNGQEGDGSVEEILDKFCAQSEWLALFATTKIFHVDSDFSDHLPILL